ncbi:hypothetical protein AN8349.2 [Aspergillus nidulans FGSC A4]|uniref:FAD/NAD(P)-binding domain-containing protein n=1 Tax=Emericella nidulans (strain FGSC A4 / ATCC 38163 / CBS 112.46 / NRRL 194 / M139) TaxID=227321 RepID=Q5ATN1_EMENI|nr:hypothetical protein [Aspergillus nidulans FGSC A4]EAA66911.1 hypothetical protein AN8349.2 [Aspergillus nidulans FGSC A4]CBF80359.1 TPA: conserved hypothetical protein [Aspergillus nidulans FGSC A4]|eukprot:XP_681618.1 hypothetical protein AN8349.2 [Aspergillus nidulans FGSC A4]
MKVIIVGAGIGGLATGIALRRKGHDVKIFERSSLLREVGAAINVCPNASQVLAQWGFDFKRSRMVTARSHLRASGITLQTNFTATYPDFASLYGGPWLMAHRVDLHSELRRVAVDPEGIGKPVELVLQAEVVDYNAENGSITLRDESIHYADLLVAADGVHSSAIRHVVGHPTPVVATGWAVFRWLIPTEELEGDPEIASLLEGPLSVQDVTRSRTLSLYMKIGGPMMSEKISNQPADQGQGGAQAIEDGAALGEIFAGVQDPLTKDEIHDRLKVFEKVRLRRVSAMQILSDAGQDRVFEVRERAQQYMPEGVKVPSNQQEFWDHNFGYDILADTRCHLQAYLKGLASH